MSGQYPGAYNQMNAHRAQFTAQQQQQQQQQQQAQLMNPMQQIAGMSAAAAAAGGYTQSGAGLMQQQQPNQMSMQSPSHVQQQQQLQMQQQQQQQQQQMSLAATQMSVATSAAAAAAGHESMLPQQQMQTTAAPSPQQQQQQHQPQQQTTNTTTTVATPGSSMLQANQHKDINIVGLSRLGQETVQDITSRFQEIFGALKNNNTDKKVQESFRTIRLLFKRVRLIYEKGNDACCYSQGMEYTQVESLIPFKDEPDHRADPQQCEEYRKAMQENLEHIETLKLKNRQLREIIDRTRIIIWEINTMLNMRRS